MTYIAAHLLHIAHVGEVLYQSPLVRIVALLLAILSWQRFTYVTFSSLSTSFSRLGVSCQCSSTNLMRLVLLSPLRKKIEFLDLLASRKVLESCFITFTCIRQIPLHSICYPLPRAKLYIKSFLRSRQM